MADIWRKSLSASLKMADKWRIIDPMSDYPLLQSQRIPTQFQYTEKLVQLLTRIAETRPYLEEYLGQPMELKLLRQAKIRAITFSNQIEGNKLEERGVTQLIDGRAPDDLTKDEAEVVNYNDALTYAGSLATDKRPFRLRDLCDLQKLVTRGVLPDPKQSGNLRTIQVTIADATTGKKLDECPEPHLLDGLTQELWKWMDDHSETNAFVKAFAFHYLAIAIHPFADGNGRTMRLAQHLLLLKNGAEIAKFVPSETAIMATREKYYAAIRQCKALGTLNPIIEYLAEAFATAAEEVVKESKSLVKKSLERKPEARHAKIMSLCRQKKEFSMSDVVEILEEVPRRTLERDLETLVSKKMLKAVGEKKARIYLQGPKAP